MNYPHLSIVTTLYKSEIFLEDFISESLVALEKINCSSFEIIFVNDGSPDNSVEYLINKKKEVPQIKIIDFSRNFGHHYAMHAGLSFATGEFVFLIDCDLEIRPSVLIDFYAKIQNTKADVVYGFQESRKGSSFEKISGSIFWKLFNFLSSTTIPENILTERLMTAKYVKNLIRLGDKNLFIAGMAQWVGFTQIGMPLIKSQRKTASTYSLKKRITLMFNAITSFSSFPLIFLFRTGLLITIFSFGMGLYLIIEKLLYPDKILSGFTTLSVLILFSVGIIVSSIGILGVYLAKIYNQTQNRPLYIIKDIY